MAFVPVPPLQRATRLGAGSPRPLGGGWMAASLSIHALALGGLAWASWSSAGVGARRPAAVLTVAAAPVAPLEPATEPEPMPELEWPTPAEPTLVETPFELPPVDETRFDVELVEVREPRQAIARWMSTPFSNASRPLALSDDGPAASVQAPAPSQLVDPLAQRKAEPVLQAAVLVHRPDPEYPRISLRLREAGSALLRLHVDERGAVLEVELVRTSGFARLDRAALEGVRTWRFEPARCDGQPVATSVLHQVTFKLGG